LITVFRLNLVAINEVKAQEKSFTGFLARGLFYTILRQINPKLAEETHAKKTAPAPFSIKPPHTIREGKLKILPYKIPQGALFSIEITSLDTALSDALAQAMLNIGNEVQLGKDGKALITSVDVRQVEEDELLKTKPIDKFNIHFHTPTYFRISSPHYTWQTTRILPLPEPNHMLSNLYRIWNTYMDEQIDEEYLTWLQQQPILIARAQNINTHRHYEHPEKGVFTIGFTGKTYYTLAQDTYQEDMACITHQLLKLAEYSNVGGNRTAGYGWITVKTPQGA